MASSAPAAAARLPPSSTNSSKNFGSLGSRRKLIGVPPRSCDAHHRQDEPRGGREETGRWKGEDPGDEDPTGDTPADAADALAGTDAGDGARDDLGRGHRHPELRG